MNGTDTTAKRLDRNVVDVQCGQFGNICKQRCLCHNAIQSYCSQNKPTGLPLFNWRPVQTCALYSLAVTLACPGVEREGLILCGYLFIFSVIRSPVWRTPASTSLPPWLVLAPSACLSCAERYDVPQSPLLPRSGRSSFHLHACALSCAERPTRMAGRR